MSSDGIDFVSTETGLQKGCFVSMDAVKWLMENVRGVGTRRQATKILQVSWWVTGAVLGSSDSWLCVARTVDDHRAVGGARQWRPYSAISGRLLLLLHTT